MSVTVSAGGGGGGTSPVRKPAGLQDIWGGLSQGDAAAKRTILVLGFLFLFLFFFDIWALAATLRALLSSF